MEGPQEVNSVGASESLSSKPRITIQVENPERFQRAVGESLIGQSMQFRTKTSSEILSGETMKLIRGEGMLFFTIPTSLYAKNKDGQPGDGTSSQENMHEVPMIKNEDAAAIAVFQESLHTYDPTLYAMRDKNGDLVIARISPPQDGQEPKADIVARIQKRDDQPDSSGYFTLELDISKIDEVHQPEEVTKLLHKQLEIYSIYVESCYKAAGEEVPEEEIFITQGKPADLLKNELKSLGTVGKESHLLIPFLDKGGQVKSDEERNILLTELRRNIVVGEIPREETLDTIIGQEEMVEELRDLEDSVLYSDQFRRELGLRPPRGLLLVGPPGTGKTSAVRAFISEIQQRVATSEEEGPILKEPVILSVNIGDLRKKYVGESEQLVNGIFTIAEEISQQRGGAPVIIVLDEIDSLVPDPSTSKSNDVADNITALFQQRLEGMGSEKGKYIVIGMTNHPEKMSEAFADRMGAKIVYAGRLQVSDYPKIIEQKILQQASRSETGRKLLADDVDIPACFASAVAELDVEIQNQVGQKGLGTTLLTGLSGRQIESLIDEINKPLRDNLRQGKPFSPLTKEQVIEGMKRFVRKKLKAMIAEENDKAIREGRPSRFALPLAV